MLDTRAFRSISYGLYLISSHTKGAVSGCTVNTFAQVSSDPPQVSVTLNKENRTTEVIQESRRYTAVALSENASLDLIGTFGFYCSRDINKFETFDVVTDQHNIPHVNEQVVARFSVKVTQEIDLGTHVMFIGTVEEAEVCSSDRPMTYAHYHEVKGGKTPPRAASYISEPPLPTSKEPRQEKASLGQQKSTELKHAWRCTVCGHIEYVDELPDDFTCPICGVGKELFERIDL